ncbi:hypothetical protein ACRALDRAFT_1067573 [Sodiomyces alcalophilus JCM 7366]|uniref:uncharacterized protein n=1 Tax=Sodiomyces alcalophilus JCM 7366 TaxID=591952 RepID=UPI0039B44EBC
MSSAPSTNTSVAPGSANDPANQIKLLISCWRNTGNGKINFQAVAEELGVVSASAANKRLERLLKLYELKLSDITRNLAGGPAPSLSTGASSGASADGNATGSTTPASRSPAPKRAKPAGKRTALPSERPAKKSKTRAVSRIQPEDEENSEDIEKDFDPPFTMPQADEESDSDKPKKKSRAKKSPSASIPEEN